MSLELTIPVLPAVSEAPSTEADPPFVFTNSSFGPAPSSYDSGTGGASVASTSPPAPGPGVAPPTDADVVVSPPLSPSAVVVVVLTNADEPSAELENVRCGCFGGCSMLLVVELAIVSARAELFSDEDNIGVGDLGESCCIGLCGTGEGLSCCCCCGGLEMGGWNCPLDADKSICWS